MGFQVIQDGSGKDTGVFILINEWNLIRDNYPGIERIDQDLPQWEKDLIDQRLEAIAKKTGRLRPGNKLLNELKRKI